MQWGGLGNCCLSAGSGKISTFSLSLFMIPSLPPRLQPALPRLQKNQHQSWQCRVAWESHQGLHQSPHLAAPAGPAPRSHLTLVPTMVHLSHSPLPDLFLLWWSKSPRTSEKPFQNSSTIRQEKGTEGKVTGKQMNQKTKKAHTCFRMSIWGIWKKKK